MGSPTTTHPTPYPPPHPLPHPHPHPLHRPPLPQAIFGPIKTSVSESIGRAIDAYIEISNVGRALPRPYLFHARTDPSKPYSRSSWCRLIKGLFGRYAGREFTPKDLRASFITFLRSDHNDQELLKSAAIAMRHSTQMQASEHYDKNKNDTLVRSAMILCESYASKF